MNRREFMGHAALAPLVAAAADLEGARADQPSIFLPDSARVYDIGRGEARILVGAGPAARGGSADSATTRDALPHCMFTTAPMNNSMPSKALFPYGWTAAGATYRPADLPW
jgi:hypothetical protein